VFSTRTEKVGGVRPEKITAEIDCARQLLIEIDGTRRLCRPAISPDVWIFRTEHPTALDTTLVCFLARLMDVGLEEIVPDRLLEFAKRMRATESFKKIWVGL
jgi:hypothetical protein